MFRFWANTNYATLTPLQPLPPISTISSMQDKFQAYSPGSGGGADGGSNPPSGGDGQGPPGSFPGMQHNGLGLGSPYSYDKLPLGMSPPHYPNHGLMGGRNSGSPPTTALSPSHNESAYGGHAKQEPLSPNSGYYDSSNNNNNTGSNRAGVNPPPTQSSPSLTNHHPHELSPSHALDHSPTSGGGGMPSYAETNNLNNPHGVSPAPVWGPPS